MKTLKKNTVVWYDNDVLTSNVHYKDTFQKSYGENFRLLSYGSGCVVSRNA